MKRNNKLEIKVLLAMATTLLACGTIFYHYIENLNYIDAFYMSSVALTTVGFGDFVPHTNIGKIFTSFYILFGVGILFQAFSLISKIRIEKHIKKVENKMENKIQKKIKNQK